MCYKHCSLAHNHSAKELEAYKPATSTPSGLCHCSSQVVPILVRALSMGICSWFISHPGLDTLLSCNGQQQGQLFFFFLIKKNLYWMCFSITSVQRQLLMSIQWSAGTQSQQDGYVELPQWVPAPLIHHRLNWILMCLLWSPNPLCKCLGWAVGCG